MKNERQLPTVTGLAGYVTSLRRDAPDAARPADLHRFIASPAGMLVHYTNNQLRSIVPPQGFEDCLVAWPEVAPAVAHLRRARNAVEVLARAAIAKAMASARRAGGG